MAPKKLPLKAQRKLFGRLEQKERATLKSKSTSPAMRQFDKHPFYKNLIKYAVVPLWEENRKARKGNWEIDSLNKGLMYHFYVFEYSASFYEALKRLHDIPLFMLKGFSPKWMDRMRIMPQEWFIYHYANYRVVATGIFDTALLMVNDVLNIGLKPKKVSRDFLKRPEIKDAHLLSSLEKLDGLIERYRQERNKYVHRSTRPEVDFVDNLSAYQLLREAKEKGIYKEEMPPQKEAQTYYAEQRDKKVIELQKETGEIFEAAIEFLDALNPLYQQKIEADQLASVELAIGNSKG